MSVEQKARPNARVPATGTILDVRDLRTQFFTDAGIVRAKNNRHPIGTF